MGKIVVGMTVSLDGFVNDRHGSVDRLYPDFAEIAQSDIMREAIETTGAVVMGRRAYEMGGGDFTGYEFQVPIFVLTHHVPERVAAGENDRLRFTFVTDGVERAVAAAKTAAGEKDVTVVGGASTVRQCIAAGLADELHLDIMPVLLGGGLRLFEHLGGAPVELERIGVMEVASGRTALRFRVVR